MFREPFAREWLRASHKPEEAEPVTIISNFQVIYFIKRCSTTKDSLVNEREIVPDLVDI